MNAFLARIYRSRRLRLLAVLLIALPLLPAAAPQPVQAQNERLVLAFYYTWFDENTWKPSKVPDMPLQPYVSRDRDVMARHIAQAQAAGIDALVVSWYGPGGGNQTETNFAAMLDIAAERGFKLALDIEITSPFAAAGTNGTVQLLRHALATHANHPAYLRVNGKPVFFFWRQQRYGVGTWQTIRNQVDPNHDSIWIAEGIDMSYQAVFDGHHLYSVTWNPPSDVAYTASKFSRWVQAERDRYSSYRYWVATVMPGYDDTRTGRGNAFRRGREDGAYYAQTWQAAIASNPDWVIINSFNEWPEGTYIEPSQAYGDRYLGLTAEWAARFKSGAVVANVPSNPAPAPTPTYAAVRVTTNVLNLRAAPSTAAPILGQAKQSSIWRALSKASDGSWWQVCCINSQRVWVSGNWVQPTGPNEALQQVPTVDPAAIRSEWQGTTSN
ncbi:MAG: endo-1,3-alpha-glucanase family glycosylhydrolase [Anaerolineae bacterium]